MVAARFPDKVNALAGTPINADAGDGPIKRMVYDTPMSVYENLVRLGGDRLGAKSRQPTVKSVIEIACRDRARFGSAPREFELALQYSSSGKFHIDFIVILTYVSNMNRRPVAYEAERLIWVND